MATRCLERPQKFNQRALNDCILAADVARAYGADRPANGCYIGRSDDVGRLKESDCRDYSWGEGVSARA